MGLKSQSTPSQGQKRSGPTWVQGGSTKQFKRGGKTQWTVAAGLVRGHSQARVQ